MTHRQEITAAALRCIDLFGYTSAEIHAQAEAQERDGCVISAAYTLLVAKEMERIEKERAAGRARSARIPFCELALVLSSLLTQPFPL
jgi:hypothetical protein